MYSIASMVSIGVSAQKHGRTYILASSCLLHDGSCLFSENDGNGHWRNGRADSL